MAAGRATWHSASKVRFQIRVEDFAADAPLPTAIAANATGAESFGTGQVSDRLLRGRGPGEFKPVTFDITPYAVNIERKSYREADECRVTIPLVKMPFDPRVIRSATVQIFGGVVDPSLYRDYFHPGVQIALDDARADGVSNQLFAGFVDEWEIEMTQHNTLQVTARDPTSLFIDAELPQNALDKLAKTSNIATAIHRIVYGTGTTEGHQGLLGARGIRIVNEVGGNLPTLQEIKPPSWFDSKKTVKKGRKRSPNDAQKMSYWDMITDLCISAGFIVYLRLPNFDDATSIPRLPRGRPLLPAPELVITNPRTYYKQSSNFGAERLPADEVRTFLYGINLDQLKIRRKYGGVKVPTIELRSFDVKTGERFTGRFPRRIVNNKPAASGKGDREEVQVFLLRDVVGPNAQRRLDEAAESIYQQLSRGEIELSLKTKILAALPRNLDPDGVSRKNTGASQDLDADMFAMKPGDPCIVGVDRAIRESARISEPTELANTIGAARADRMIFHGIPENVALAVEEAMQNDLIQHEFRVSKYIMTWAHTRGWEFEVQAINYLDVRHAVELDDDDFAAAVINEFDVTDQEITVVAG